MIPRCIKVFLHCRGKIERVPYFMEVSKGTMYGDCEVVYCYPNPCRLDPGTEIEFVEKCEYFVEELSNNVAIHERCGEREDVYVYPKKVYREIVERYAKPMISGEAPDNVGLLLLGAPGTGKSELARLVAKIVGIPHFQIRPDVVLKKYVGESEQAIKSILESAKRSEPSIVIIDDAEWLLSARKLASEAERHWVLLNIQNILFDYLQKFYNQKRRILFIASSNVKQSELDPAFLRYGRFGDPIYVPLPDIEAVEYVMRFYLGDRKDIKDLARRCVNSGLSMADVMQVIREIKKGRSFEIKPRHGRGYARIFVDPMPEFERVFELVPRESLSKPSRFWIPYRKDVAVAISLQIVASANRSSIFINDPRYIDEAVHIANVYESPIIVSTELHQDVQKYLDDNATVPILLCGRHPPAIDAFAFPSLRDLIHYVGLKPVICAVLRYRNIDVDSSMLRKIENKAKTLTDDSLEKLLTSIARLGVVSEKLLDYIR